MPKGENFLTTVFWHTQPVINLSHEVMIGGDFLKESKDPPQIKGV
jgi:hypothetical protein